MYRMKEKGSKDFIYNTQVANFYLALSEYIRIETPHQYNHTYIWHMNKKRHRELNNSTGRGESVALNLPRRLLKSTGLSAAAWTLMRT